MTLSELITKLEAIKAVEGGDLQLAAYDGHTGTWYHVGEPPRVQVVDICIGWDHKTRPDRCVTVG